MRSRRDQAIALARIGLNIFPLPRLSKEPIADVSWSAMMTTDEARINAWFDAEPEMNYGVNGGSEFAVVDLDEKNGKAGITNFTALNMEQPGDDWCLDTFTVKTPSGGKHLYLRVPYAVANSASKIGSGIDIRGARGYVVGPGCLTEEVKDERGKTKQYAGAYVIETETEVATAPQWLLNDLLQHHDRANNPADEAIIELDQQVNIDLAKEFLSTRAPAIEGAGGDEWTYKTCAKLKDFGISEETALGLMLERGGWNAQCEPAWTAAELGVKVHNAFSYGQNSGGVKGDLWDAPGAFSPDEYLKGVADQKEAERIGLAEHLFDPLRIVNSRDHREMVIPEWLPATGYTAFLARRGVGKTVQMMDMACRIACDMEWHDMPVMDDFAVIYICGEDDIGARDQFRAWVKKHDTLPSADRFFFMDTTFDLLNAQNVEMWVVFLREQLKGRRAVVFVDTWQRATSHGDQNDNVEMQLAVHHAEAVAKSFKGPAVIAFHPPKADANVVLGSSVIENSSSAIWTMVQENEGRIMRVTRIKGKGHDNYQIFSYGEIALGDKDTFGRDITGLVPTRIGGTTSKGSAAESDRDDAAKYTYASVIRGIMNDAESDPNFAEHRAHAFTVKDMARRILTADTRTKEIITSTGEELPDEAAIVRRLRGLFQDKATIYSFEDGVGALILDQSTKTPKFKLVSVPQAHVV